MKKLALFGIFIFTLCLVKSDNSFKDAVLKWKLGDDLSVYDRGFGLSIRGSVPKIHKNAFENLKNVSVIDISNTNLEEIQEGAFQNLPKLNAIVCRSNNLRQIRSGVFANLTLEFIELGNNNIGILENGAFQNSTILELFLQDNKIEQIGKEVFDNTYIKSIVLSNNSISKLEAGVFDRILVNEWMLGLDLLLQHNKLQEIDPQVFSNRNIGILQLDDNKISELRPGDFRNMPELRELNLSCNKLQQIPARVFSKKIHYIYLNHNEISTIATNAFHGMNVLLIVDLSHNRLRKFDPNWFHKPFADSFDVILHFADNLIEDIPSEVFKNYPTVKIVDFRRNRIKKVASDAFKGTKRVEFLTLSENLIEKWDERTLVGRSDLEILGLDLRRNQLRCFEGELDEVFAPVERVWFDGNPIRANCVEKIRKFKKTVSPIESHSRVLMYKFP